MKEEHVNDIIRASYARLIVDEYQDCALLQHALVFYMAPALPTVVLGDPMQAIFGWQGNELADWDKHVCEHFPLVGELTTPWRWRNAGKHEFGEWLLDARRRLRDGEPVDLGTAPPEVSWVYLDGTEDRARQLRAARTPAPERDGSVLIIGKSTSPPTQQEFASQTPGAVTVEAVDLKDLVRFARELDFSAPDALAKVADFAGLVMTNVGPADLVQRVGILERGAARKKASDVERAALRFKLEKTPSAAVDLFVEIGKDAGVRAHRPAVLRACFKALRSCDGSEGNTFYDTTIRAREQNRLIGRPLPKRAVGSTLLLKGLEAEVAVILDAADLDAKNLYVAMTRGSKRLVACSRERVLQK
jgi:DNA helicase-2/ATP-dependent DNA helicase PcrA